MMKKAKCTMGMIRITVLSFLCSLAMLLSGCTRFVGQTYETDIWGGGMDKPNDLYDQESFFIDRQRKKLDRLPNRTISYEGYTGEYQYYKSYSEDWQTAYDMYSNFKSDVPQEKWGTVFLESGSDRIVGYCYSGNVQETAHENAREYVIDEARKIAEKYINVDEYQMTVKDRFRFHTDYGTSQDLNFYLIRFVKWIGRYKTSEKFTVCFTSDGQFMQFFMQNIGRFENYTEEDFPEIDEQAYEASVRAFLSERYKGSECEFKIRDRFFALSAEQKLLLVADLDVRFADQGPDAEFRESAIGVKTVLNV